MNQGGEPGHDDYGLPPVDIQVPDDARELYRDVQAYHRELRAMRRHERSRRFRAPLARTSLVIPVIAGCLVLAMLASMVLTMFSANPYFRGTSGAGPSTPATGHHATAPTTPGTAGRTPATGGPPTAGSGTARSGTARSAPGGPSQSAGVPLPGTTIDVDGRAVPLRGLTSTALVIVPARCGCAALVRQLLSQARLAGVAVYLVGTRGSRAQLRSLAPPGTAQDDAFVAIDAKDALGATYRPVGLTALLVDAHGAVTVMLGLHARLHLGRQLRSLRPTG